jgi:hypothetical protein
MQCGFGCARSPHQPGESLTYLGDLAIRIEQGVAHSVDHGVFDLQPEGCGVVGLAAEDFLVGEVGRQSVDGLYSFHDGLAAGEWLIAERAV